MTAKDYLQQVQKLDKIIENKLVEADQWKSMAESITQHLSGDRVQSSGNQQKMEDAVIRYIELDHEITRIIDRLADIKMEVIATIERLPAAEYDLLHKVYIQGVSMADYADKTNQPYTNVTTTHGRALKKVQAYLDGKEKGSKNKNFSEECALL